MSDEQPIRIAAAMFEMRTRAKAMLTFDRYRAMMIDFGASIRAVAKAKDISEIQALTALGKQARDGGHPLMVLYLTAAYVELVAPSMAMDRPEVREQLRSATDDVLAAISDPPTFLKGDTDGIA